MSTEARSTIRSALKGAWVTFRSFRRTRPFWGGVWLILGGWMVLRLSMVPVSIVLTTGMVGVGGWLTGGGMIAAGLLAWFAPAHRSVAGMIGIVFALTSLVVSNLGGYVIGMMFGLAGSSMVIGWGPKRPTQIRARYARFVDRHRVREGGESVT